MRLQGSSGSLDSKESACNVGDLGLIQEDPWRREWFIHSSILALRIPWTEKPGRLHTMGLQRIGHA